MKTTRSIILTVMSVAALSIGAFAQQDKKYKINININKNGEEIIIDTTFASESEMQSFLEQSGYAQISFPELPELPEIPDMENLRIEINNELLSDDEKAQMEKEMKQARKEMKKANKEMQKANEEMQKAKYQMIISNEKKELESGEKIMKVTIDNEGDGDEKIIIRKIEDDSNSPDDQKKLMFINIEDDGNSKNEVRVYKLNCDSLKNAGNEIKIIRKSITENSSSEVKSEAPSKALSTETGELKKQEPSGSDYQLEVSDFKLFPNPTAGKINLSFKTESNRPVQIKLLDGSGKVIIEDEIFSPNGFYSKELNIDGKSRGTYLLQIKSGDKWRHEKVVLK